MPNVLTLGTFDLPHFGHLKLLRRCSEMGNVVVGLNSDEFVERYKGRKPIMTYDERCEFLMSTGFIEYVFKNDQTDGTIKDVIEDTLADMIVVGSDWMKKDYLKQIGLTVEYLEGNNISLSYVPYTQGISTTEIKRRITEYNISSLVDKTVS